MARPTPPDPTPASTPASTGPAAPAVAPAIAPEVIENLTRSNAFRAQVYAAISVQRPVALEYVRSLRREKPHATPAQILAEAERRYITTVTLTSTGVGASAAIPAIGIPVALGLGGADLLFFYEATALYAMAVTELHGIPVHDAARARPLVLGMLLGQKSQSRVSKMVMHASGAGSVDQVRSVATNTVGRVLPRAWGEVLTQQLPDSALAPLTTVIAREALKTSAVLGAGTLGKVVPFGVGAIIGGVGSYTFAKDVVRASRSAFSAVPLEFPEALQQFTRAERVPGSSRAARAFDAAKIVGGSAIAAVGNTVGGAGRRVGSVARRALPGGSKRAAAAAETAAETAVADAGATETTTAEAG